MAEKVCPSCGNPSKDLLRVDRNMRQRISDAGGKTPPAEICPNCYSKLSSNISQGAQLKAKQSAREQQRLVLWRSRVTLIKQARDQMNVKAYSEAAVLYEKYLRLMEIIYDVKPGDLEPEFFNNKAREKELTVITSVYWDLFRIYDTSPRYGDRQKKVLEKLCRFAKVSAILPTLIRQAKELQKTSRNPMVVKQFIRTVDKRGFCFIATAAFSSPDAIEVHRLRFFRDQHLETRWWGQRLTDLYYLLSPPIARVIASHPHLQSVTRWSLRVFLRLLEFMKLI